MGLLVIIVMAAGRKAGLATTAGIALGLLTIGTLASLGMAQMLTMMPILYEILRWIGLAYMLYLAFDMYRDSALAPRQTNVSGQENSAGQLSTYFRRGLITNLLNPKAGLFFLVALPGFIPERLKVATGEAMASIALVAIYVTIATCIHLSIVALAARLQPLFQQGRWLKGFQTVMALMLVGIAVWQFWSSAR